MQLIAVLMHPDFHLEINLTKLTYHLFSLYQTVLFSFFCLYAAWTRDYVPSIELQSEVVHSQLAEVSPLFFFLSAL